MNNRLDRVFQELRKRNAAAFIPFITAGDPDLQVTAALLRELSGRGADVIELGFPYSDPIADGPVIQTSYTRALERGVRVADIMSTVRKVTSASEVAPIVAMVSYSVVFRHGPADFVDQAVEAGFSGLLVPDLPAEESAELWQVCERAGLRMIQLVTPLTDSERLDLIISRTSGFLYFVSVAGTTGEREGVPAYLRSKVEALRRRSNLPVCVGFGVSTPAQAAEIATFADGVICGSAIVRRVTESAGRPTEELVTRIGDFVEEMVRAVKHARPGPEAALTNA